MSANTQADGGSDAKFDPETVESEVAIAEQLRMPHARDADKVKRVLEETNAVAIKLKSSWWGNEAFGIWQEWFFVKPDTVSDSGKALFLSKGISLNDPVGKLKRAEHRKGQGGWTPKAVRRAKRKALKAWDDDYMVGPGGGDGFDERDVFHDGSVPLSVIEAAFRTPEPKDHVVFPAEGDAFRGTASDADIRSAGTKRTQYGEKTVLKGDTYKALAKDEDNAADDVWETVKTDFHNGDWVASPEPNALIVLVQTLNDHGYSVGVKDATYRQMQKAEDAAEAFDVNL